MASLVKTDSDCASKLLAGGEVSLLLKAEVVRKIVKELLYKYF
jgi:hypothetical protein